MHRDLTETAFLGIFSIVWSSSIKWRKKNNVDSIWRIARTRIETPVAPVSNETNLSTLSMKDSAKLFRNFDRTAHGTGPALGQGHTGATVTACLACLSMNTRTTGRKIGSRNNHSPTNAVGSTSPTLYRVYILSVHGSQNDWESRLDIRRALSSFVKRYVRGMVSQCGTILAPCSESSSVLHCGTFNQLST